MLEHQSYGIICIHETAGEPLVLLVEHVRGDHWAFSKGTPEAGETPLQTAIRELYEETGVRDVVLVDDVSFSEEYRYTTADGKHIHKTNTFFLGFVDDIGQVSIQMPDEIRSVEWLPSTAAHERLTHTEAKVLLGQVLSFLTKNKK